MGIYPLEPNYTLSNWYDYQGAYDLWAGTDLMLDLTRQIIESDNYIFQGVAFPTGSDIFIPANSSFSGSINLIPYSYIISLTGWSANANQFTLRIYDKGAQTDVYAKQFAWYPTVISNMTGQPLEGVNLLQNDRDKPFGPYFFRDPLVVLPPGALQIQLTNVATGPLLTDEPLLSQVQMFFNVAVPKNTVSMQMQNLQTVNDPTGTRTIQGSPADAMGLLFGGG